MGTKTHDEEGRILFDETAVYALIRRIVREKGLCAVIVLNFNLEDGKMAVTKGAICNGTKSFYELTERAAEKALECYREEFEEKLNVSLERVEEGGGE